MGRIVAFALALMLVGCTASVKKAGQSPPPTGTASSSAQPGGNVATGPKASGIGFPRGTAPVYLSLGARGTVVLDPRARYRRWYALKMLVAVDPLYNDRLVITAMQVDAPQVPKFQFRSKSGLKNQRRLVFGPGGNRSPSGWRYGGATLLVPGPGRYVMFFRGKNVNEAIPIRTKLPCAAPTSACVPAND